MGREELNFRINRDDMPRSNLSAKFGAEGCIPGGQRPYQTLPKAPKQRRSRRGGL
jgi:hypothetical protein